MTIEDPWYLERDHQSTRNAVQRRSPSSGHASTLPMTEEQMSQAAEREKAKVVGFALTTGPSPQPARPRPPKKPKR
jgi:hypothetical protein